MIPISSEDAYLSKCANEIEIMISHTGTSDINWAQLFFDVLVVYEEMKKYDEEHDNETL